MVFHHFLVQLYILIKFWPEKIIFVFFCEFESSGNSVMHCKGGTLPKKRWISKDLWNTFLLWFWMRFGDHRALYHVPIVIIPTLVEPVVQAIGRPEFENGLRTGVPKEVCWCPWWLEPISHRVRQNPRGSKVWMRVPVHLSNQTPTALSRSVANFLT